MYGFCILCVLHLSTADLLLVCAAPLGSRLVPRRARRTPRRRRALPESHARAPGHGREVRGTTERTAKAPRERQVRGGAVTGMNLFRRAGIFRVVCEVHLGAKPPVVSVADNTLHGVLGKVAGGVWRHPT